MNKSYSIYPKTSSKISSLRNYHMYYLLRVILTIILISYMVSQQLVFLGIDLVGPKKMRSHHNVRGKLRMGYICHGKSPWAAPFLLVKKRDGA